MTQRRHWLTTAPNSTELRGGSCSLNPKVSMKSCLQGVLHTVLSGSWLVWYSKVTLGRSLLPRLQFAQP